MDLPFYLSTESSGYSNAMTHECYYLFNVDVLYADRLKKYGSSACMNVGAVVGGAVGGFVLLIGCGVGAYFYSKKG